MSATERHDLRRRLSVTQPAPDQPSSFFDQLGLLASESMPVGRAAGHGWRPVRRVAAAATATVLLLSGAAYAGALGAARDGVRHMFEHPGPSVVEPEQQVVPVQIAPQFVLEQSPGVGTVERAHPAVTSPRASDAQTPDDSVTPDDSTGPADTPDNVDNPDNPDNPNNPDNPVEPQDTPEQDPAHTPGTTPGEQPDDQGGTSDDQGDSTDDQGGQDNTPSDQTDQTDPTDRTDQSDQVDQGAQTDLSGQVDSGGSGDQGN